MSNRQQVLLGVSMSLGSGWGLLRSLIIYYGQPWKRRRMRSFYAQFMDPGDLCFDVGAHVGNRVGAWRWLGARVLAVEPQPAMIRMLERLYGRDSRVTIAPVALGAAEGTTTLFVNTRNPTLTSASEAWRDRFGSDPALRSAPFDAEVEVEVATLDGLIASHGEPSFCKIDVEGLEDAVLQGLSRPLAALSETYTPRHKTLI